MATGKQTQLQQNQRPTEPKQEKRQDKLTGQQQEAATAAWATLKTLPAQPVPKPQPEGGAEAATITDVGDSSGTDTGPGAVSEEGKGDKKVEGLGRDLNGEAKVGTASTDSTLNGTGTVVTSSNGGQSHELKSESSVQGPVDLVTLW